jgi:hypothetical protein
MADGEIVERLVVHFDAQTDMILQKLSGLNRSVHGTAQQMKSDLDKVDIGKAFDNIFSSGRSKVLEEGAAKIGILGKGLEALGPLGIAAGAGLAAVAGAAEMAIKASEWAEGLQKMAEKTGVSTTALQKFGVIAANTGIGVNEFNEAIETLTEKMGQAQAGILRPIGMKAFEALGFDRQSLLQFTSVEQLLDAMPARFAKLGTEAEKAGIARRLGVDKLLPYLKLDAEQMTALNKTMEQHKFLSEPEIERAAQFNHKLEDAKLRIAEAGREIGASLLPMLADLVKALADAATWWAKLWSGPGAGLTSERATNLIKAAGQHRANAAAARNGDAGAAIAAGAPGMVMFSKSYADQYAREQELQAAKDMAEANAIVFKQAQEIADNERKNRDAATAALEAAKTSAPKTARTTRSESPDRLPDEIAADLERAQMAWLRQTNALAETYQTRAENSRQMAIEEGAKAQAEIRAQELKLDADKKLTDAQKDTLRAELSRARGLQALATDAQIAEINAREQAEARQAQQRYADDLESWTQRELETQIEMQPYTAERAKLEQQLRDLKRAQVLRALKADLDERVRRGEITSSQADALYVKAGNVLTDEQNATVQTKLASDIHNALDAAIKGGWPGLAKYMADKLRETMLDRLSNLLANILLGNGSGSVGGLFGSLFHLFGLPGFADGTDSAPGGLAIVGERSTCRAVPRCSRIRCLRASAVWMSAAAAAPSSSSICAAL